MIILDTDFLINAIKSRIDFITEIKENSPKEKIAILDKTLDELKKVNNINSKTALALIKARNIKIIETNKDKSVDELIPENAKSNDIIATQDKELKRKLKFKGIKTITIRQKKYLKF